MIEKIKISGFKRIAGETLLTDANQINIIQGNNRQGKSSLLEAITWALVGAKIDDTKSFLNHEVDEMRVKIATDRAYLERSYIDGQKKDKVSATTLDGDRIEDAEKKLAMMYPPQAFDPTVFVTMDSKSLAALIRNCMADKVALTDEEKESIGFNSLPGQKLAKTNNDIEVLDLAESYWYDTRTERGRVLNSKKNAAPAAESDRLPLDVIEKMETMRDAVKEEIRTIEESNAKISAAQRSAATLKTLRERRDELTDAIDAFNIDEDFDIDNAKKTLETKKKEADKEFKNFSDLGTQFSTLEKTIGELGESSQIVCPISKNVKCTTDMGPYVKKMKAELKGIEKDAQSSREKYSELKEDITALEEAISIHNNHANLLKELERTNGLIESIGDTAEGVVVDLSSKREDLDEMNLSIARARACLEFDSSAIEDAQKAYDEADTFVATIRSLKEEKAKGMEFSIKGLEIRSDGIFFRGVNIKRECTSYQIRLGVAILRELFPNLSLLVIDRFETLDDTAMEEFIKVIADTDIQVFAAHVSAIPENVRSMECVSVFEMDNGEVFSA